MSGEKSSATTKTASSSTQFKDTKRRGQTDAQMIQNVLLIWLDSNIDVDSSGCQNTITHLRRAINAVQIFADENECIQFLGDIAKEKVCMIISGALGQNIVPRVHDLFQIDSIFIFCGNKTYHEGWAKKWRKIKGVYTEINPICDALKKAARQCEQNAGSISIMGASDTVSNKSLNRLDPCFIYTQIMKEILLTIDFRQQHIDEFIEHCRQALAGNSCELEYVDQLSTEYREHTPIWWYTLECFLYKMLNRALRTMNAELMVKSGFFIADLHRQIQELHQEEFGGSGSNQKFTVYRGQGMEKADFEKMIASKGGLISFNCFLTTSKSDQVSQHFAERALQNPQLVGVLFVMAIDPALSDIPFASIAKVANFGDVGDEVLFSMNTVFRIERIKQLGDHSRLFQVELSLTSDKDNDLRLLMNRIREETCPDEKGWYRLALLLAKMGEFAKAKQVFVILLQQANDERIRGSIYHQLGMMASNLGQYDEAIRYHERSIGIEENQEPCNYQNLANSYNNIGSVYNNMDQYPKAFSFYQKALAIRQKSLPPTHPDLANCYKDIGSVYKNMGDYSKALSYQEKALAIQQKSLPPTHPDLANCYKDIGSVYKNMGDYSKALSYQEKALAIQQTSLPSTHPDLASSYNSIGSVYEKMKNYPKAHLCYERAVNIAQGSLPPDHPTLQKYRNNLTRTKEKL